MSLFMGKCYSCIQQCVSNFTRLGGKTVYIAVQVQQESNPSPHLKKKKKKSQWAFNALDSSPSAYSANCMGSD